MICVLHYIGVLLCMTHRSHNLFEVHNHLLTLNVTLRSMLDIEEAAYHEMMVSNYTGTISLVHSPVYTHLDP